MTYLNKMWAVFEQYQPYADDAGHGESWLKMTQERTKAAADDAWNAAPAEATRSAVWAAGMAASAAAAQDEDAEWWADRAIMKINKAMQEMKS